MDLNRVAELIQKNDNEAYRELFEAYYQRTYAVVFSILRRRESAEDITQDAFIRAFNNLHQLKDGAKFGAWLAVIASNLARNYLKREKKMIVTDEMPVFDRYMASDSVEDEAIREMELEQVRKAIRCLTHDHYQVLVLQYYYNLKVDEIASLLSVSQGTVKSRLHRAKKSLSEILEQDLPADCHNIKGGDL